jgi:hypothetical protein
VERLTEETWMFTTGPEPPPLRPGPATTLVTVPSPFPLKVIQSALVRTPEEVAEAKAFICWYVRVALDCVSALAVKELCVIYVEAAAMVDRYTFAAEVVDRYARMAVVEMYEFPKLLIWL